MAPVALPSPGVPAIASTHPGTACPSQGVRMPTSRLTRRAALGRLAAGFAAPFVFRAHGHAAPAETVLHASFGAGGMAWSDIQSLAASRHLRLVAVAEVDLARTAAVRKHFPKARVYQ